jgi:hypothetical protein
MYKKQQSKDKGADKEKGKPKVKENRRVKLMVN